MPLIEKEKNLPAKKLITLGIPLFVLAVVISMLTHQFAHIIAERTICKSDSIENVNVVDTLSPHAGRTQCPLAALAGICWTFLLAIVSFGLFVHRSDNLFLASMAFVNASSRIPQTLTVFLQLLFHNKSKLVIDETTALSLLPFRDPTISVLIVFAFLLVTSILTVITIHDLRKVPWKFFVAIGLFLSIVPIENLLWSLFGPLFS